MVFHGAISLLFLLIWKLRCPSPPTDVLISRYGRSTLTTYRSLEKLHLRENKIDQDIRFLTLCLNQNVMPKFLRFKIYSKSFSKTDTYREWQSSLLEREIKQQQRKHKDTVNKLTECKSFFKSQVSFLDYWTFFHKISEHTRLVSEKVKWRHEKKLRSLGIPRIQFNDDCIFNFSSKCLTQREKELLMLGLDFCIPFYRTDWLKHFMSVEKVCNTIIDCAKGGLLKNGLSAEDIVNRSREFGKSNFSLARRSFHDVKSAVFRKEDLELLKKLGKDDSIVIMKPDKGKGVVILDKSVYMKKMTDILDDKSKFKKVTGDLFENILKLEDRLNRMLRSIKDNIDTEIYSYLYASGTTPGIMYGLPKVHKSNFPLRPIVSSIKTAGYNLAKFLLPMITPLTVNQYSVSNSKCFSEEITNLNLPSEFVMTSYDVESLFTNVPLNETIDIILSNYDPNDFFGLSENIVRKLLKFATSESCFLFNGILYNQVDGISMGSCLGPVFANAFMCKKEVDWLNDCPAQFKPIYYKRYVDDLFLIFKDEVANQGFYEYINRQHDHINFTCENEVSGSLAFLDVLVSKTETGIVTGVYRKRTFTGLGLNWYSYCPEIYKINSIKTLLNRAYSVCSDYFKLHDEICRLRDYFAKNNYKLDIFNRVLNIFLSNKQRDDTLPITTVPKLIKYVKMPFYGKVSYQYRKLMLNLLRNSFASVNFRIVFTNDFRLGSFFNIKDRVADQLCSNIVYLFTCPSCEARYVGCSGRSFKTRIYEHLGKSHRTGKFLNTMSFSAIRNHSRSQDHQFSPDNFKIIAKFNSQYEALLGEKLIIKERNPELNISNN